MSAENVSRATVAWPGARGPQVSVRVLLLVGAGIALAIIWLTPPDYLVLAAAAIAAVALTLRWPVVGFALLAFSAPWGDAFPLTVSNFPLTSTDILIAAIGVVWLVDAAWHRHSLFPDTPWNPFIAIFLGAIIISATQASDVHASVAEIIKWLELSVVFLAGARLLTSRSQIVAVVMALVLAGVSQAFLGFVQVALQAGPHSFVISNSGLLRAYGTFAQPNPYAGYLNMVLPLAIALSALAPRGRAWFRLATVLIAGAILASASRGAFLAGAIATVVVLGVMFRRFRALVWLGTFAAAVGALFASYQLVPLGPFHKILSAAGLGNVSFTNVTHSNFSAVERAAHWIAGLRMFAAHPLLGVGIGNYSAAYPAYHLPGWRAALGHAHDYYINIAAEAGIVGLIAYLLFAGSALWYSFASLRRVTDPFLRAVILGVVGALVATSFHNLFDVLYVHGLVALLGLLMALVPASLAASNQPARMLSDGSN
ncbi:MAG: O-antigen ligase family protein [Chloroflexota bacterium]